MLTKNINQHFLVIFLSPAHSSSSSTCLNNAPLYSEFTSQQQNYPQTLDTGNTILWSWRNFTNSYFITEFNLKFSWLLLNPYIVWLHFTSQHFKPLIRYTDRQSLLKVKQFKPKKQGRSCLYCFSPNAMDHTSPHCLNSSVRSENPGICIFYFFYSVLLLSFFNV